MDSVGTKSENLEAPSQGNVARYQVFKHLPTFKPSARNSTVKTSKTVVSEK